MWCAVCYSLETKELKVFDHATQGYLEDFKEYIKDATHWIGHSFISFDRHVISKFTGHIISVGDITDTLVRSRLYNSGRDGGHSLERWGAYFHIPKVGADYEDWENYDPIIVQRCIRDVGITLKLYNSQQKEGKHVSQVAERMEHDFAEVCDEIKTAGFPINIPLLDQKYTLMAAKKAEMEAKIQKAFPPRAVKVAEVEPKLTKAGTFARNTKGFNKFKDNSIVVGPFTLIEWQEFNIGSPKQVVERMNEAGWKPVELTKSGKSYKVSETNMDTLPDTAPEEAHLIAAYLKLKTRIQLMDNWYDNLHRDNSTIHGSIIPIGTITHRCAHRDPNTGNIPGNDKWNIRECWGLPNGGDRRIVGVDAKGIQLRVLDHLTRAFTDDDTFTKEVLHGDPHTEFTLPIVAAIHAPCVAYTTPEEKHDIKRKRTKRFIYAWLLGAGYLKVGSIFGVDKKIGKAISEGFADKFPGLRELKGYLKGCSARGWYPAPDGRFIPIKSEHYALSAALQGVEAVLMKLSILLWRREAKKRELDAWLIAFVHDEVQFNSHKDCAEEVKQLMIDCIVQAGEMLNLRTPMDGDGAIGFNWAETH